MPVYRFPDNSVFGYFLGTFVLACICLILEKYSVSVAIHINKDKIISNSDEMAYYQDISTRALMVHNKNVFKAANSVSNEAYGKLFFSRVALSAAALWPVVLALGWMQCRFADVDFTLLVPVTGADYLLGYVTTFVLCSVIVRIVFHKLKAIHSNLRPA